VIVFHLGGAIAQVGEQDTAYGQRDAAHNVNINAVWLPDDADADAHMRWARECYDALEQSASGRAYVNFLADDGQDRVRAAYGEEKYARLAALKRGYDPGNFFRLNANIEPAATPAPARS
jgi:hypothetical protein